MALSKLKPALLGTIAALIACAPQQVNALNIVLNPDGSFYSQPNGQAALYAFQKAANYWNQTLSNNTTLVFNVSYAKLGANIIGSTSSNSVYVSTSSVYAGLAAGKGGALDDIAVANLHPLTDAGGLGYRMPDSYTGVAGTGTGLGLETATRGSVYDNDDTDNNRYLYANTSTMKALNVGFDTGDTDFGSNVDASITFSSAFGFDFNPTDGLAKGTEDFIAVAVHEMGHALGFVSGTDLYDYYAHPNGPGRTGQFGDAYDWDTQPVLTTLDLFRYSGNGPDNAGFDPATGQRYLQLDPNRNAGFSIDGVNFFNQSNETQAEYANFATGQYNGDLAQASHWKDATGFTDKNGCFVSSRQVGIMDPTSGSCQQGIVTANDLAAMDAMGYNLNFNILNNLGYTFNTSQIYNLTGLASLMPEPSTWASMLIGFGAIGGTIRRRRAARQSA